MIIHFFSIPIAVMITCLMLGSSYFSAYSAVEYDLGACRTKRLSNEVGALRNHMMLFSSKRLDEHKNIFCICRGIFYIGSVQAIIWLVKFSILRSFSIADKYIEILLLGIAIFCEFVIFYFGLLEIDDNYKKDKEEFYLSDFQEKYKQLKQDWNIIENNALIAKSRKKKILSKQASCLDMIVSIVYAAHGHGSLVDQFKTWDWAYSELQALNKCFVKLSCPGSIEKYSMFWIFPEKYVERYFFGKKQGDANYMLKSIEKFFLSICDTYATCYDNDALSNSSIQSIRTCIKKLEQVIADFKNTEEYINDTDFIETIKNIQEGIIKIQRCCNSKEKLFEENT